MHSCEPLQVAEKVSPLLWTNPRLTGEFVKVFQCGERS